MNQELELLVSGAVLVSLFQLPDLISHWWLVRESQLSGHLATLNFLLFYAGTILTYGLLAAFGGHFLIRGFWVALLGTRSAFSRPAEPSPGDAPRPAGGGAHEQETIDWSAVELGQTLHDYYRQRTPRIDVLSDQVDRLASSLFAFLFVFLFLMLAKSLAALTAFGAARGIGQLTKALGGPDLTSPLAIAFGALFLLAASLSGWIDRRERNDPRAVLPPWQRRLAKLSAPVVAGPISSRLVTPITLTFLSRGSRRTLGISVSAFFYALIGLFLLNVLIDRGVLRVDSYAYLPVDAAEESLDPLLYDSLRRGPASRSPTLSSDIVTEPYLRLFLPYDAREDNDRLAELCPDLTVQRTSALVGPNPPATPPAERRRVLDCIGALYELTLDGDEWTPDWIFARHPDYGGRGLMAYLDADALAKGRHLLVIRHRPLPGTEDNPEADRSRDEFFLPFWR